MLEEIVFFGKFPYRENNFPVCGPCAVVCGDFEFFQSSLCVGPVLWCAETLKFFRVPLCVGTVLWCVGTLKFFKVPLCVGPVLWCGDFEIFQSSLCVWTLCCGV